MRLETPEGGSGGMMSMASLQQFLKSPSAYTLAATILTGAGLYYGILGRLDRMDDRMVVQATKDAAQDAAIKELSAGLTTAKVEFGAQLGAIGRDVSDTKVTLKGVETSVGWIARSFGAPPMPASPPRQQP